MSKKEKLSMLDAVNQIDELEKEFLRLDDVQSNTFLLRMLDTFTDAEKDIVIQYEAILRNKIRERREAIGKIRYDFHNNGDE